MSAEIIALVGLVIGRLDVIGTVVLLVQLNMEILFADTLDEFKMVHVNVFDPEVILSPTSNEDDWPAILNAVKEGD